MVSDWVQLSWKSHKLHFKKQFLPIFVHQQKSFFKSAICDPFQKSWNSMKMVNKNYLAQQMSEKIIKKV